MKPIHIPYAAETDPETGFQVLSALDQSGKVLAVVSESRLDAAEKELAKLLLHLLGAEAAKGRDRFRDLSLEVPQGRHISLTPIQVVPIRLRLARAQADLRQADVAERLGITQQTYAKLERPGANPTLQTLCQVENVLGRDLLRWA